MKKVSIILLAAVFMIGGFGQFSQANITETSADYLVEIGEYDLRQGDYDSAIHEFSKALILDPQNKRALAYLDQFGIEGGIYDNRVARQSELGNMAVKVEQQEKELKRLQWQKKRMADKIVRLNRRLKTRSQSEFEDELQADKLLDGKLYSIYKHVALKREHKRFKDYALDQYNHQDKLIHVMEDLLHLREQRLEDASDHTLYAKLDLARNRKDLLNKMDELRELNEQYSEAQNQVDLDYKKIHELELELEHTSQHINFLIQQREHALDILRGDI